MGPVFLFTFAVFTGIITKMIGLEIKNDVEPVCPHCSKQLGTVWMRELTSVLGKRYIYFCPHCRKVLGITHRKGFWMG
jgi:hypothetical protein